MAPFADALLSVDANQICFLLVIGHIALGKPYFY